jgi:hypothetical protein
MGEVVENPSLSARFNAIVAATDGKKDEDLTLAERLTRRALLETAEIDLGTEDEPLPTTIRVPTQAELDRIRTADWRKRQAKNPAEAAAIEDELAEILGSLCRDESLNKEFWRAGFFLDATVTALIVEANREVTDRIIAARQFRSTPRGDRALPVRKGVRKNPA